jgi:hypothetical protein
VAVLRVLLFAWLLMAASVVIHAVGIATAIQRRRERIFAARSLSMRMWRFIQFAALIICLHLLEISVWALFYLWEGALPTADAALYFSAVTYTTTGYGDVVLPDRWRLLGSVEALTGILMCGWSTAAFVVVATQLGIGQTSTERAE